MKFSDIPGHASVKSALRSMVQQQRLPHALLLSGQEGVGKLAMARALAAYLHCEHPTADGDSCGQCGPCRQHAALNFPDMLYVFPTSGSRTSISDDYVGLWRTFLNQYPLAQYPAWLELLGAENAQPAIRVAESENLLHRLSHSNYSASTRVVVMWLPEKLTAEAANKLLKEIEEPAEGQMFIMVSNAPHLILETIYSRLQRVTLGRLTDTEVAQWLVSRHGLDAARAASLAAQSQGILARTEALAAEGSEDVGMRDMFRRLMRLAFSRNVGELKRWSEQAAEMPREKILRLLAYCTAQIRISLMYRYASPDYTPLSTDDAIFTANFSRYITPDKAERLKTEFEEAGRDVAGNANARMVLFDMALQCIIHIRNN